MKKAIVSLLIVHIICWTFNTDTACVRNKVTRFSQESVHEILEPFAPQDITDIAVLADESSLAQKIYAYDGVKELRVAITDPEACEDFECLVNEDLTENRPQTCVTCGGLDALELTMARLVIITALDVNTKNLVQRITKLPDGVKLLTRDQLEFDELLHLEAIRAISISPSQAITMYEYVVKRPTVSDLLTTLYTGITGFGISQEEADLVRQAGGDPTYGEIEFGSAEKIFTQLVPIGPRDVFYDLGCGVGKLALWVYLATPAKKSVGIELSDSRFALALKAKKMMEETILPQRKAIMLAEWGEKAAQKKLDIVRGNIADIKFDDATIIYMCATCYPDALMQAMVDKFVLLPEGLRIVTLKELPQHPSIHLVGHPQRFPMTWSAERGSPVYIYEMRHPQLKDLLKAYEETTPEASVQTVSYDSVKTLCNKILQLTPQDIFYTIEETGSVAAQAYLETPVHSVVGIIAGQDNFDQAEAAYKQMTHLLTQSPYDALFAKNSTISEAKTLQFLHENGVGSKLNEATKVFIGFKCCEDVTSICKKFTQGTRIVSLINLEKCSELQFIKTHELTTTESNRVDMYEYSVGVVSPSKQSSQEKPALKNKK